MSYFDTTWYINYGNGSSTGYYGVTQWAATSVITAGTFRRQLATPAVNSERCFVAIVAGTTNTTEPTWVLTRGAKTTDNTVTWQECTGAAGVNGDLTNCPVWVASSAWSLGAVFYDSVSGSLQICSTAGTSTSSEPTFSAIAGVTTTDGSVTWTSLGSTSNFTTTVWQYPHARLFNAFASGWGVIGNNYYVSNNHAETQSSAISLTPPGSNNGANPNIILCVNSTAAPPTSLNNTASISTTGANSISIGSGSNISWYMNGIILSSGFSINLNTGGTYNGTSQVYENCVFNLNNTSASETTVGSGGVGYTENVKTVNCNYIFGATSQSINWDGSSGFIIGGSIAATGTVPTALFVGGFSHSSSLLLRDVNMSAITGTLISPVSATGGYLEIENCSIGSGVAVVSGSLNGIYNPYIFLHNCDSSGTNYRYYFANGLGTIQSETTIVRSGGASNGTTPLSWNLSTTASPTYYSPLISQEISQWNNSASPQTATIYLTSNTPLDNSKIWLEIEYPSSSTNALGSLVTTRAALFSAPVALTNDGSSWGGSALTYKYSITTPSFTPAQVGPLKARIYTAVPNATIYIDPLVVSSANTSGRQYLIPGWGYLNAAIAGVANFFSYICGHAQQNYWT